MKIKVEQLRDLAGGKRQIGLGDLVEKLTTALGIKPCKGCKDRKGSANKIKLRW